MSFLDAGKLLVEFIFEVFFIFSSEDVIQGRRWACVDVLDMKKLTYYKRTNLDVSPFNL